MPYHDRLVEETNRKLDDLAERKQPWRQRWIAIEICRDHEAGLVRADDDDEHFWRHCGYEETMEVIGQVIKRRTDPDLDDDDKQPTLPGFNHLHPYYRIKRRTRDGKIERLAVHIDDMSDDEILAKADEYDAQALAMQEHAKELRRFARLRARPAAE
jgi:hypothetical protein